MKIKYENAISLLINEFSEMERIYENNTYDYEGLPYAFYESEFTPYIMKNLRAKKVIMLHKIFDFVEKLLKDGDDMIVNMIGVSVVESLFFEGEYQKYENVILGLCGELTRQSFLECS
jgi:hypothetical protein